MFACLSDTYKLLINEFLLILTSLTKSSNINKVRSFFYPIFFKSFFSSILLSYNCLNFITILSVLSTTYVSSSNVGNYTYSLSIFLVSNFPSLFILLCFSLSYFI